LKRQSAQHANALCLCGTPRNSSALPPCVPATVGGSYRFVQTAHQSFQQFIFLNLNDPADNSSLISWYLSRRMIPLSDSTVWITPFSAHAADQFRENGHCLFAQAPRLNGCNWRARRHRTGRCGGEGWRRRFPSPRAAVCSACRVVMSH
jgi:hypothetical protein